MVFCNNAEKTELAQIRKGHNPYFNRWFSAIFEKKANQYASRSHNPYFNRWFSAILFR